VIDLDRVGGGKQSARGKGTAREKKDRLPVDQEYSRKKRPFFEGGCPDDAKKEPEKKRKIPETHRKRGNEALAFLPFRIHAGDRLVR